MGDLTRRTELVNIDRPTYLEAFEKVHWDMVRVLSDWMENEKRNLEGFIENPQGHVDYNPYLIIDFDALRVRTVLLGQAKAGLDVIVLYKQGSELVTESMHDYALDHIPVQIWQRLYEWMETRLHGMEVIYNQVKNSPRVPIKEYEGFATFDSVKFMEEMAMYKDSVEGLGVVIDYKIEELQQPEPEPEEPGGEE